MFNLGSLGNFFVGVGVDLSQLRSGMNTATSEVRRASELIQQQTKGISDGFKQATQSALGMVTGIMGLRGIESVFRNTVGAGWQFASTMQQTEIAFTNMLGSGEEAAKMLEDLQDFAAKTPFEFPDLQKAAKQMLAMGFEAKNLIPTLRAVGDAAGGLGMGNEGIERIIRALGQMRMKGKVSAEEMRQLAEAGIPAWQFLAQAIFNTENVTAEQIQKVMKMSERGAIQAEAAISAIMNGMNNKFGGMMEAQSKTFDGMMATIRDTFGMTWGKIMQPLLENFTNNLMPSCIAVMERFAEVLREGGMEEAFKLIFPAPLVETFSAAVKGLGATFSWLLKHIDGVTVAVTVLVSGIVAYKVATLAANAASIAAAVAQAWQTRTVQLHYASLVQLRLANIAATASEVAHTFAVNGLTAAFIALSNAMKFNPMFLAISLGIAAVAGAVAYFRSETEKAERAHKEEIKNTKEHYAQLAPLTARYDELSRKVKKTKEEKEELKRLTEEIAKLCPEAVAGYDKEKQAVIDLNIALEIQVREKRKPV